MIKPVLLLIEDEALLAIALEAELADAGFDVVTVLDGSAAAALIEGDPGRFACIVTDIRLPGLLGWDIARRARQLVPDMPIVYMSGDSGADWLNQGVAGSVMLPKPFALAELVDAVARVRWGPE